MSGPVDVLAVVAVVESGGREMLVLNRKIKFVYEREGKDFIGSDGPFRDVLRYERGGGRFVAFAGRELSLQMADGTTEKVKDHWWQSHMEGFASVAYGDLESLRKCYVFSGGACIAPDDLAELRGAYSGCVYPYWDYEKVITHEKQRRELCRRWFHEERRCRALISEVKRKHSELVQARAALARVQGVSA